MNHGDRHSREVRIRAGLVWARDAEGVAHELIGVRHLLAEVTERAWRLHRGGPADKPEHAVDALQRALLDQ